ncbi:MAG: hypothetical protein ACKVZH_26910 [Blastocatellia bacterium]
MKRSFYLTTLLCLFLCCSMSAAAQTQVPPGTTVSFPQANTCGGSQSGGASVLGVPIAVAGQSCNASNFTVRAYSALTATAIGAVNPKAQSFTENTFAVTRGNSVQPAILDALIFADAEWDGILGGLGVDAVSKMSLRLDCVDVATNVVIGSGEFQNKTGGGVDPRSSAALEQGTKTVSFAVKLTRGRNYKLRFVLETEAHAGIIGLLTLSVFSNADIFGAGTSLGNRGARLKRLSVSVDPDLVELITMVKDQVSDLQTQVSIANTALGAIHNNVNNGFTNVRQDIANLSQATINRFNAVDLSLTAINSKLNQTFDVVSTISRNTTVMIDQLTTLQTSVNTVNNKADTIINKADTIIGKSDTIIGKVDNTNNNVLVVSGKVDDLSMKLMDFQRRAFRLEIEQALVEGDRYNVTSFQMPQSAGGNLEEVRSVVAEVIDMCDKVNMPSGSAVAQAKAELESGDIYFKAKGYKDAYDHYRAAYLHVATVIGNRRP